MADWYVKNGGSGTHGGSYDPTSDSWAAAYDSITAAITASSTGDRILVSHLHNKTLSAATTYTPKTTSASPAVFISVDDTSPGTYRPGATEDASSGIYDIIFASSAGGLDTVWFGFDFISGDDMTFQPREVGRMAFHNCSFSLRPNTAIGSDNFYCTAYDGGILELYDCTLKSRSLSQFSIARGCSLFWNGGSLVAGTGLTTPDELFDATGNGGGFIELTGVDFSGCASGTEIAQTGNNTSNDLLTLYMYHCTLPANFVLNADAYTYPTAPMRMIDCQVASGQRVGFAQRVLEGEIVSLEGSSSGGIHRTDGTPIATGIYQTMQVTTSTFCSKYRPCQFVLASKYEDDYSGNGSARVYCASTTALTDATTWIVAYYGDGTTSGQTNRAVSAALSNSARDPLASGTTLTTDSGSTWMNGSSALTGYNEYYIDVALTNGSDSLVEVHFLVGSASTTVYVDTEIDFV